MEYVNDATIFDLIWANSLFIILFYLFDCTILLKISLDLVFWFD